MIVGVVGAGWGDIGPPRQRYMAFDKKTGAVRWVSTPAQGPFDDANNQASPTVAVIGGRRLVIGGGADGWIYAVDARTGDPVWRYQLSVRGLNSPPVVVGDVVYAAHCEENPEGGPMGAVVAIDGKGTGDITKTATTWRTDGPDRGLRGARRWRTAASTSWTTPPTCTPSTRRRASCSGRHNLGTIGRAAPVVADGKLFLTEQNGKVLIVEPGRRRREDAAARRRSTMPEGRPAEIWGSVAVAYGRLYFTTEEGLYSVGRKGAPFKATPTARGRARRGAARPRTPRRRGS